MQKNVINDLSDFVRNKGLIDSNRPPKKNEPFYEDYMIAKIDKMKLSVGDTIEVVTNEETVTGILIDDTWYGDKRLYLLTNGKKVWKCRENVKEILIQDIMSLQKLKDKPEGFDIKSVNLRHRTKEEIRQVRRELHQKIYPISEDHRKKFVAAYPDRDITKGVILCIHCSLFYPFINGKVTGATVTVLKNKEEPAVCIKDNVIKHVHPNKNHFTVCGHEKGSECIIIPFDSFKELKKVRCISCLWTMKTEDGSQHSLLEMTYPDFTETPEGYNIFNVTQHSALLQTYHEGLSSRSMFSGDIYTEFQAVGLLLGDDGLLLINGTPEDQDMLDMELCLHNGDLMNVIESLEKDNSLQTELYVKEERIHAMHFICDCIDCETYEQNKKEKLDFSRFL